MTVFVQLFYRLIIHSSGERGTKMRVKIDESKLKKNKKKKKENAYTFYKHKKT